MKGIILPMIGVVITGVTALYFVDKSSWVSQPQARVILPPHTEVVMRRAADFSNGYIGGYKSGSSASCSGTVDKRAGCENGVFDRQYVDGVKKQYPAVSAIVAQQLETGDGVKSWLDAYDLAFTAATTIGECGNGKEPSNDGCRYGGDACSHDNVCSQRQLSVSNARK